MRGFFNSLTGRVFLVLVGGILISAAITLFIAQQGRDADISRVNTQRVADRVQNAAMALDSDPNARERYFERGRGFGMELAPTELAQTMPPDAQRDGTLTAALAQTLDKAYAPEAYTLPFPSCGLPPPPPGGIQPSCRLVRFTLHDGERLALMLLPPRAPIGPPRDFPYGLIGLFTLLVGGFTILGARLAVSPMRSFASAAEALGNDIDRPPLAEIGPSETRRVVQALNVMQARIQSHLRERTSLLGAISHDLRTPLTRMRLRLEKIPDADLRDKLVADVAAMQSLIVQGLDLARGHMVSEPVQTVRLKSVLDSVCADAVEAGGKAELGEVEDIAVLARPQALARCVANLVENAIKYGSYARVSAGLGEDGRAIVRVRDGGPGIPEAEMAAAFEPFVRLDTAGGHGVGLGLSIARGFARQNGGDLTLRNHPEGGLEAILALRAVD